MYPESLIHITQRSSLYCLLLGSSFFNVCSCESLTYFFFWIEFLILMILMMMMMMMMMMIMTNHSTLRSHVNPYQPTRIGPWLLQGTQNCIPRWSNCVLHFGSTFSLKTHMCCGISKVMWCALPNSSPLKSYQNIPKGKDGSSSKHHFSGPSC